MSEQILDPLGRFILSDFPDKKPFVNFLPGIAGVGGIPMWVFYVNRGQGISSFGIASKDNPIMEFQPANKAYRQTSLQGFRSFFKMITSAGSTFYEPFSDLPLGPVERRMYIGRDEFEIEEVSSSAGLKTNIQYFTVPNEAYAGLVRILKVRNLSGEPVALEFLDGTPIIIPYGINDATLKNMARLAEAWMEVFNLENDAAYFRVRASTEDTTLVERVYEGNFAISILASGSESRTLKPIVDPKLIFGSQTSFSTPDGFLETSLEEILRADQHTLGQTPCAFFGESLELDPGQEVQLASLYGYLPSMELLAGLQSGFTPGFVDRKLEEARQLSASITAPIDSVTAKPIFDAYARQTFLDNVMRGGMPIQLGEGKHVFHVFSRKHGDPEREYNYYYLTPEKYSQGNGNYRDVNQNRRSDVIYFPFVGAYNLHFFLSLIQLDGYNPLSINGSSYRIADEKASEVLAQVAPKSTLGDFLARPFTPGGLWKEIEREEAHLQLDPQEFFELVFSQAEALIDANHAEGYWIDHWTYNLDLLDSYLAVYPDRVFEVLFGERNLPWFESYARVNPRQDRYQITADGLRQHEGVYKDEERQSLQENRAQNQTWQRKSPGSAELYLSSVFEKFFITLILKAATLDPDGLGIEMEAGKPGWYDALNGLPGLLGSSVSETYEVYRLAGKLLGILDEIDQAEIKLPDLFAEFLNGLVPIFAAQNQPALQAWRETSRLREEYRRNLAGGLSGKETTLSLSQARDHLQLVSEYLQRSLNRINGAGTQVPSTYFYYQAANLPEGEGAALEVDSLEFFRQDLPLFLEGPVHALRIAQPEEAQRIYQGVKASGLYDSELGMYKVNESLEGCSHEIGRASAFPSGWLENESVWLHMEYKYLLEILRAGLYEEFYEDIQTALVPFMDVDQYGRSPLENSSFIASSAYPAQDIHGNGFVARLSGSTAEFLSIWVEMFAGKKPFLILEGELVLGLQPALADWLFDQDNKVSFTFLGHTRITYHNPGRVNTWEGRIAHSVLLFSDGSKASLKGELIPSPYAEQIRDGLVEEILVELVGK